VILDSLLIFLIVSPFSEQENCRRSEVSSLDITLLLKEAMLM